MKSTIVLCIWLQLIVTTSLQDRKCPASCSCHHWNGLNRTDCVNKNMANTNVRGLSEKTQVLDFSRNCISILHGNEFQDANLKKLKILILSNNQIERIDKLSFNGLKELENVDLSKNQIEYLNPETFKYNPNLKILDVSFNTLGVITDRPLLSNVPSLQNLNIASCRLNRISETFFQNLGSLTCLDISGNNITKLDVKVFQPLRNLTKIDLSNAYKRNVPEIRIIEATNVPGTFQKVMPIRYNVRIGATTNRSNFINRNDITCNAEAEQLKTLFQEKRIEYQDFCLFQKIVLLNDWSEKIQEIPKTPTTIDYTEILHTEVINQTAKNDSKGFQEVLDFFQGIPSLYAILCGFLFGIIFGYIAASCGFKMLSRRKKVPEVPIRSESLHANRFGERTSTIYGREDLDFYEELTALNTPPSTPPSPYRSTLRF